MQVLSILDLDSLLFCFLAICLLGTALCSVLCKKSIDSILSFFLCSIALSGIVILYSNSTIGIFISLLYFSLSSVFLIINKIKANQREKKKRIKKIIFIVGIFILLIMSAYITKNHPEIKLSNTNEKYLGLAEITAFISAIFLIALSGIASLKSKQQ